VLPSRLLLCPVVATLSFVLSFPVPRRPVCILLNSIGLLILWLLSSLFPDLRYCVTLFLPTLRTHSAFILSPTSIHYHLSCSGSISQPCMSARRWPPPISVTTFAIMPSSLASSLPSRASGNSHPPLYYHSLTLPMTYAQAPVTVSVYARTLPSLASYLPFSFIGTSPVSLPSRMTDVSPWCHASLLCTHSRTHPYRSLGKIQKTLPCMR
jgi:hypothetical protein